MLQNPSACYPLSQRLRRCQLPQRGSQGPSLIWILVEHSCLDDSFSAYLSKHRDSSRSRQGDGSLSAVRQRTDPLSERIAPPMNASPRRGGYHPPEQASDAPGSGVLSQRPAWPDAGMRACRGRMISAPTVVLSNLRAPLALPLGELSPQATEGVAG